MVEVPCDSIVGGLELAIRRSSELGDATRGKRVRLIAGGKMLRRGDTLKSSGVADSSFVHCAISAPLPQALAEARAAAAEVHGGALQMDEHAPLIADLDPDVAEARRLQMLELGIVGDVRDERWMARFAAEWAHANRGMHAAALGGRGGGHGGGDALNDDDAEEGEADDVEQGLLGGGGGGGGGGRAELAAALPTGWRGGASALRMVHLFEFAMGFFLGAILGPFALILFFWLRGNTFGFSRVRRVGVLVGVVSRSIYVLFPHGVA